MRRRLVNLLKVPSLLVCAGYVVFVLGLVQLSEGGGTYWLAWRLDGPSVLGNVVWPGTDVTVGLLAVLLPAVLPSPAGLL